MTNKTIEETLPLRLGIVGGLGTQTSCDFCLNVSRKVRARTNIQPGIVLENVSLPISLEEKMIMGEESPEMFSVLTNAVRRLEAAGSNLIVIPCNTVHCFIDELRKSTKVRIISILDEIANECERLGLKKVGILATQTSINKNLHSAKLKGKGIEFVLPSDDEQKQLNTLIVGILNNNISGHRKKLLVDIINRMKSEKAEAVIFGCTDFHIILSEKDSPLPLIDTLKVLEEAAVNSLIKGGSRA